MLKFQIPKIRIAIPYVVILGFLALPLLVQAELPPGSAITIDDVSGIVGIIARFMIAMSMVCAVIFIVLSGIMTMMAQDDPAKFSKGLLRLKHAAIGAGVVLATGVIINTVAALVDRSFFCQISILGICLY
ncbi:MAG: hypothetical protein AAB374_00150 [Patescibacteria group bacterium]